MQANNPYQAPGAAVGDQDTEAYGEVKVFSAAGRIGRVRYISYSIGFLVLFYVLIGAAGVAGPVLKSYGLAAVLMALGVVGLLIVQILLTIQRCHDFDVSGWLSLLAVVPIAALIFWIVPGTRGPNRFGPPTPPNSAGAIAVALILPAIFVIGILAAIAVPAYSDYVQRAKAAQTQR